MGTQKQIQMKGRREGRKGRKGRKGRTNGRKEGSNNSDKDSRISRSKLPSVTRSERYRHAISLAAPVTKCRGPIRCRHCRHGRHGPANQKPGHNPSHRPSPPHFLETEFITEIHHQPPPPPPPPPPSQMGSSHWNTSRAVPPGQ